ncbi:MAG: DUF1015 family protein [Eggerthellales bacterium]|nr:DUF1015 family protein [Eggerthellales bacterium]
MAHVYPFPCMRPTPEAAEAYSSLPFDFYSVEEADVIMGHDTQSFMHVDAAGVQYTTAGGRKTEFPMRYARQLLNHYIIDGKYFMDIERAFYLYRLTTADGHSQTGIMGGVSIDDGEDGTIRRHENTRVDKENGCIAHLEGCGSQTSAVFLAFRATEEITRIMNDVVTREPLYDFNADDVQNTVWKISDPDEKAALTKAFEAVDALYIADGHHRTAATLRFGMQKRAERSSFRSDGKPYASELMMSVMFPSDQLIIHDYNRSVADLNGKSVEQFMEEVSKEFTIEGPYDEPYKPTERATFGMYLDGHWYKLTYTGVMATSVGGRLDVSILQDHLLDPILGIDDPRTNKRIDFVRGTRGLKALEHRLVNGQECRVSFALYPTDIEDLFAIADADQLMPPKSTCFEPKIRSGIFVYPV